MQPGPAPRAVAGGGTLRMVVRPQVDGAQVRVRLSNVYGSAPLTVDAVSAARAGAVRGASGRMSLAAADGGAAARRGAARPRAGRARGGAGGGPVAPAGRAGRAEPGPRSARTEQPVTFGGRAATVIPPGAEAVSDPVPVAGSGPLAVTIAVPALPAVVSEHPVALQTSWLAPRGARSRRR